MTTKYYSIPDASKEVGIAQSFLRKLIKTGRLPFIMSGNKYYVSIDKLLAELEKMETTDTSLVTL